MPVISKIGHKNWRMRCVIYSIYAILSIGSLSMIYPLMITLAGSVKSEADSFRIVPVPLYFYDDDVLWGKYVESKYVLVAEAEKSLHEPIVQWRKIEPPQISESQRQRAEQFIAFREQVSWPTDWYRAGHMDLGYNARAYLKLLQARHDDDILAYSDAVGVRYKSWSQVSEPNTQIDARYYLFPKTANYELLDELKQSLLPADRLVVNLDGVFWNIYLRPKWTTIKRYNQAHGTNYDDYSQVLLRRTAPPPGPARDDWEDFVRHDLNTAFIRFDSSAGPLFQAFLAKQYEGDIDSLNALWDTDYEGFDQITLMARVEGPSRVYLDYSLFLSDKTQCPLETISIYGVRQGFEDYLAKSQGVGVDEVEKVALPIVAVDYIDYEPRKSFFRWEFASRNYIKVLDYIFMHGNGVRNTVIYCGLMILVTLTINPLAAYALSRYKPPSSYKILLFCMCTMAFPPEVTMIPSFLLLKQFPAIGLLLAVAMGFLSGWLLHRLFPNMNDAFKGILGGSFGLMSGFYILPMLFGADNVHVSLLNTFWALVLPGAANGFGIFLLKGFFDSLPQELYEAAEIDGGGEFTKFWTITISLSKPILAVLALSAFTAAYSEFMMALVIIPDPQMWTIMVWLFQLQSQATPAVLNASIVLAAIPTFLVFLFCQNLIMRGIVVPVEK